MSTIVNEIPTASAGQAVGIIEVNRAISQMDEIAQQNAALVVESATAAESMSDQARNLNCLIDFFKLK